MSLVADPAPGSVRADADILGTTELHDVDFGAAGNSLSCSAYGWSAPETDYRWAIGTRSALCLDRPDAPHGYLLEITWSGFVPQGLLQKSGGAGQTVSISVGGRQVARHEVGAMERVVFRCPAPERHEDRLLIQFDHPDAARPSAVSGHTDDRLLALCFCRLRVMRIDQEASPPPAPPLPPPVPALVSTLKAHGNSEVQQVLRTWPPRTGQAVSAGGGQGVDIVFGLDGNARALLAEGWSGLEDGYVWAVGSRARLALPRLQRADSYLLCLLAQPFTAGDRLPAQLLQVFVNGTKLAEERPSAQFILQVEVPWEVLSANHPAHVSFVYPDAARPMDLSGIGDDRVLGFQFKRLMLTRVAAAPEPAPAPVLPQAADLPPPPKADLHTPPKADLHTPPEADLHTAPEADLPLNELMLRFESLGQNCEFGLVQRSCGAEPLGLLRFASAPLDKLLPALGRRFAGMGQPGQVQADLTNGEYMILDKVYGFYTHAWVKEGEKTPAEIEAREARRVPFLVRKLIEDLQSGEKLFVYHAMTALELAQPSTLASALRKYGPATLLWVELANEWHPPGDVYWIGEGMLKAHIDRFAPGENAHDFSRESWVALCRRAWRLHHQKVAGARQLVS
jgi:hypothetical protein